MTELGLKIGGVPEHFNLPWRLAIEEGKFSEIGLQLHWSDMSGGTGQMIRGLETGSIDIAVLLTEGVTKSILQGLDAKILGVYVVSPLKWGIHVPVKSDIQQPDEVENKVFAISRYGSGSHMMAYVMADQHGWELDQLKFNVIGDIYGGLWALENNEAQAFLWEKYTTHPFVEQNKCRYIGDVVTPWPCFVVAVRNEVAENHPTILTQMLRIVNEQAKTIKANPASSELISWRYQLKVDQVDAWLSETDWNYTGEKFPEAFETTTEYLKKLHLVSEEECLNWEEKLFI
jgi:ABC-type nitrate/sulfonate/bicarbonate transport system substrate-binding protein